MRCALCLFLLATIALSEPCPAGKHECKPTTPAQATDHPIEAKEGDPKTVEEVINGEFVSYEYDAASDLYHVLIVDGSSTWSCYYKFVFNPGGPSAPAHWTYYRSIYAYENGILVGELDEFGLLNLSSNEDSSRR